MDSFFEDAERQLPIEIWKIIINYCCWTDPQLPAYSVRAASRVINRVLSLTSRWCRQLMQNLAPFMPYLQAPLYPGCDTTYCCHYNYVSLLEYAIEQGASIQSITVTEAARFGHIDCLKVLQEHGFDPKFTKKAFEEAALHGQVKVLQHLIDKGIDMDESTVNSVVMSGSVELLQQLQKANAIQIYHDHGYYAARSGSLAMVKYIEQYTPLDQQCIEGSAYGGSIEVLQYLLDKGLPWEEEYNFYTGVCVKRAYLLRHRDKKYVEFSKYAIQRGAPIGNLLYKMVENDDLETLQELADMNVKKFPWDEPAVNAAGGDGKLEMLKLLVEICEEDGMRRDSYHAVRYTTQQGHFECFKFMIEQGGQYDAETFFCVKSEPILRYMMERFRGNFNLIIAVVQAGNIFALKFLHENGFTWPENILDNAVHFDVRDVSQEIAVIEYLRERGCIWTGQLCANAAKVGAVEVLKYLHENGCPWDERTTASATESLGRSAFDSNELYNCLLYALDNGCPINAEAMRNVAQYGDLDMLSLLHRRGVPWNNDTCTKLLQNKQLEMLKYAHENGAPWTTDTIAEAIRYYGFDESCFDYAIENGCPWDPQQALLEAMNFGNTEAVEWIQKKIHNNDG